MKFVFVLLAAVALSGCVNVTPVSQGYEIKCNGATSKTTALKTETLEECMAYAYEAGVDAFSYQHKLLSCNTAYSQETCKPIKGNNNDWELFFFDINECEPECQWVKVAEQKKCKGVNKGDPKKAAANDELHECQALALEKGVDAISFRTVPNGQCSTQFMAKDCVPDKVSQDYNWGIWHYQCTAEAAVGMSPPMVLPPQVFPALLLPCTPECESWMKMGYSRAQLVSYGYEECAACSDVCNCSEYISMGYSCEELENTYHMDCASCTYECMPPPMMVIG